MCRSIRGSVGCSNESRPRFVKIRGDDGNYGSEVLADDFEGGVVLFRVAADRDVGDVAAAADVKVHVDHVLG